MNRRKILLVAACLVCFSVSGGALAQTGITGGGNTTADGRDYAMTDAQFRGVLEQALKERDHMAAADALSSTVPQAGEDETAQKAYRYEGSAKGTLFGATLPQRSFNNIDYPY